MSYAITLIHVFVSVTCSHTWFEEVVSTVIHCLNKVLMLDVDTVAGNIYTLNTAPTKLCVKLIKVFLINETDMFGVANSYHATGSLDGALRSLWCMWRIWPRMH